MGTKSLQYEQKLEIALCDVTSIAKKVLFQIALDVISATVDDSVICHDSYRDEGTKSGPVYVV
jgi:hypothetical protein